MEPYAEKKCPLCGQKIWADAAFCRFCNRDLEDEDLLRAHRRTRKMALGLAGFFGVFVLALLIGSLLHR